MELPVKDMSTKEIYKLLCGAVVPRPIAWVSTKNSNGQLNIAPYSFFGVVSKNPPVLSICIDLKETENGFEKKDTLINIEQTGCFVINIVPAALINQMAQTAEPYDYEVDEFAVSGLTPKPSVCVDAPGIQESPIQFECKTFQIEKIGVGYMVLGEVVHFRVQDEYIEQGRIKYDNISTLGRLAGKQYCTIDDIITLR